MRGWGRVLAAGAVATGMVGSTPAWATWSVVAVDPDTREVGVAGATCGSAVWMVAGLAPGEGALAAQGSTQPLAKHQGVRLLALGSTPEETLAAITQAPWDVDTSARQYGAARLGARAAAFHGAALDGWWGGHTGDTFAVQGNTLAGARVVDAARDAFEASLGWPLDERLLRALEAGAAAGGDSRCPAEDAAQSAFLMVAAPEDDAHRPRVDVKVDLTGQGGNPVTALRKAHDAGQRGLHCDHAGALPVGPVGAWLAWRVAFRRRRR